MKNMKVIKEQWWLMDCSLPDLNWARLRVFDSEDAEVFDSDGVSHKFSNQDDALAWLAEDEFIPFDDIDIEDERAFGINKSEIQPPTANNDSELARLMCVKSK